MYLTLTRPISTGLLIAHLLVGCLSNVASGEDVTLVPDPPSGFSAVSLDALRLTDEQSKEVFQSMSAKGGDYFPNAALMRGASGKASVDVIVESDGRVFQAKLLEETPKRYGFGRAAVKVVTNATFQNKLARRVIATMTIRFDAPTQRAD